ncbi:MAG: ribosomal protein L7/L12 [Gemmataceae bacterium]
MRFVRNSNLRVEVEFALGTAVRERLVDLVKSLPTEWRAAAGLPFDVILHNCGPEKIKVIKVVRMLTGFGLKEAKTLVEACPRIALKNQTWEAADSARSVLEEALATVEVVISENHDLTSVCFDPSSGSDDPKWLVLVECGSEKIRVIREIRVVTGLELQEAIVLVELTPSIVMQHTSLAVLEDVAERFAKIPGCQVLVADKIPNVF